MINNVALTEILASQGMCLWDLRRPSDGARIMRGRRRKIITWHTHICAEQTESLCLKYIPFFDQLLILYNSKYQYGFVTSS